MNRSVLSGLAALSLLDIAAATPLAAQVVNGNKPFTGIYTGVHGGGFDANSVHFTSLPYNVFSPFDGTDVTIPGRFDILSIDGGLAGGHIGYMVQLPSNVVVGLESDFTALFGNSTASGGGTIDNGDGIHTFSYVSNLDADWQATLRGRLGFALNNLHIYGTAGVAIINVSWSDSSRFVEGDAGGVPTGVVYTGANGEDKTLVGGVVGTGFEYALFQSVLVGLEYRYEDFGNIGSVIHGATPQGGNLDSLEVHKVLARVSFKIN
ncbi:MAG: hypothetical protein VX871_08360 [Pseudomonadota bacterium]|nr:hypothetical protein [Pseudomonadota bacterium]